MANEIRLGKVSSVDHAAGMVQVVYHEKDDDVTRMIPILSTVFSGVYSMPEVGDQVLVLHLSNGSEAGVVMGRPWSEKTKPPEGAEKLYRLDMDRTTGVAIVRYDGKTKELTIHCDGPINITTDDAISVSAPAGITVDTPLIKVTGDVVADGKNVSLTHHTHPSDSGGTTGEPN